MENPSDTTAPPLDEETRSKLVELEYLEASLGRTGQLALRPLVVATGKDLWQLSVLVGSGQAPAQR